MNLKRGQTWQRQSQNLPANTKGRKLPSLRSISFQHRLMDQLEHEVSITEVLMKDAFINSSTVAPQDVKRGIGDIPRSWCAIGLRVHVLF